MPSKQHNRKAVKVSDAKGHERKMAKHGHPVAIVGRALLIKAKKPAPNALRGR